MHDRSAPRRRHSAELKTRVLGIGRACPRQRWHRKTEHGAKWKLCDNNPGLMPEKAG